MRIAGPAVWLSLALGLGTFACAATPGDAGDLSGGNGPSPSATSPGPQPGSDGGTSGADAGSPVRNDAGGGKTDGAAPPPPPNGSSPQLAGCDLYPADNAWNEDITNAPVDTSAMATIMPNMHGSASLHPDWGTFSEGYGIPITIAHGAPPVVMTWSESWGADESDKQPCAGGQWCYPIPADAYVEGGSDASGDRHVLVLDTAGAPSNCTLYELWNAHKNTSDSGWTAANGAVFHLGSDALRPDGWTSADAAGLPIVPGLVRLDEAKSGAIKHAIRFTMNNTYNGYIHPATHAAGLSGTQYPPMGMKMRLKASVDTSGMTPVAKAIVEAMKHYGVILADNGSNWYISGATDDGWSAEMDGVVSAFSKVHGSDFEIVQSGTVSTNGL